MLTTISCNEGMTQSGQGSTLTQGNTPQWMASHARQNFVTILSHL